MKMIFRAAGVVLPLSAVAQGQTLQILPTPTGQSIYRSDAHSISDSGGRIVGWTISSTGQPVPVSWLPGAPNYTTYWYGGFVSSRGEARVVSEDGTVAAGYVQNAGFTPPTSGPSRWLNGQLTILTSPAGLSSGAISAISADGQVLAATLNAADQTPRATVWDGTVPTALPLPAGTDRTKAGALTPDGQMLIGTAGTTDGRWYLFSWTAAGGSAVIREVPYSGEATVTRVSTDGSAIVGIAGGNTFRYEGGVFELLGAFHPSAATSDLSVVVGGYSHGLVRWTESAGVEQLTPWLEGQGVLLGGYTLETVRDMTPDGRRIVGQGRTAEGQQTGFLIILPEGGACYANCDGSTVAPVLNVADFACFLQRFAAGESYANCDGSTTPPVLNVADFTCFLQGFAAGCP